MERNLREWNKEREKVIIVKIECPTHGSLGTVPVSDMGDIVSIHAKKCKEIVHIYPKENTK